MSRTMVAPGRWHEEEPASPGHAHRQYATQGGPIVVVGKPDWNARESQRAREARVLGQKPKREPEASPICGVPMWYGETCHRRPGHSPGHRSRTIMDADVERRRTTRAVR